jgi:hypothetical protein
MNLVCRALLLFMSILILSSTAFASSLYVLPQADSRENVSPVSIRGTIINLTDSILTIQSENKNNDKSTVKKIRLTKKTDMFTEFGGIVRATDLALGQYVWIWYKSKNINATAQPEAAALILWSTDSKDQPSGKDKKTYDKKK